MGSVLGPKPQLRSRELTHENDAYPRPGPHGTPSLKLAHQASGLLRGGGPVDVPHPAMELVGLAATVADLEEPVQEAEHHRDGGEQRGEGIPRRRPAVDVDRLGDVAGADVACLGREDAVSLAEVVVIGVRGQGDAQDAAATGGRGEVALPAGTVGVMLIGRQVRRQPGRVADGRADQAAPTQPLDQAVPLHLAMTEADLQQPGGDAMRRQEQGIGQLIDGAGHVSGDEARAEPVGAVVGDDLAELQAMELAGPAAEAVEAIAPVESVGEELRGGVEPAVDERPDALGVVPYLVVLRPGHGDDDLLGPAWRLRRGEFSFTIHWPGVRSRVHFGILFCGKKKDDEKDDVRIPGTSIPAIR